MIENRCSIEDCDREIYAKILCRRHYYRQRYRQEHDIPLDLPSLRGKQFCKRGHDRTLPGAVSENGTCYQCSRDLKKAQYPELRDGLRDYRLRKYYGIDQGFYDYLYKQQSGKCAICGNPEKDRSLAVDHDHVTGKVRGLLCNNCNNGLGRFSDDVSLLKSAVGYLERNQLQVG